MLISAAFGMLLLLLSVATAWVLADTRLSARRQATQASENLALSLERDIRRNMDLYDLSLRTARAGLVIPDLETSSPAIRRSILFDGAVTAENFASILISGPSGAVIYDSGAAIPRVANIADRPYFAPHRIDPASGLRIDLISRAVIAGTPSLALSRRIDGPGGIFMGVVVGAIRVKYFDDLFSQLRLGEDGNVALYTTDGKLVTRQPGGAKEFGLDLHVSKLFALLAQAPSGNYEANSSFDGIRRLYSYRRVGDSPLVVVIGVSTRALYADWRLKAWATCIILLVFITLSILLAAWLRRELRRRSRAEQAARRSEAKFHTYFAQMTDAISIVRVSERGFTFEEINPAAETLFGLRPVQVIGQHPAAIWPAERAAAIEAHWRDCVRGGQPTSHAETIPTPAGLREMRVVLTPVADETGRIWLLLDSRRDITDFMQTRDNALRSRHARDQDEMLAGVARELARIKASADPRECCDHILAQLQRVRGEAPLHLQAVSMQSLVNQARQAVSTGMVAMRTAILPGAERVWADETEAAQAVRDLIAFACTALPAGGTLRLTAAPGPQMPQLPPGLKATDCVALSLTVEGPEMNAAMLARGTEPFTAGVDGLGLAAAAAAARRSGGALRMADPADPGNALELWLLLAP